MTVKSTAIEIVVARRTHILEVVLIPGTSTRGFSTARIDWTLAASVVTASVRISELHLDPGYLSVKMPIARNFLKRRYT